MRPLSEFDPAWPHGHVQENGRPARIIGEIKHEEFPLLVAVPSDGENSEKVAYYTADGMFYSNRLPSALDLVNAPAPKRRVQGWVNVNRRTYVDATAVHASKAEADDVADADRIACIYLDVEEGEGLS